MRRRVYLGGLAGSGLAGFAGCAGLGDAGRELLGDRAGSGGGDYDVGMTRTSFEPDAFETAVGETVVWKNTSDAPHTVTAYEDALPDGAEFFASGGYESEAEAREAWEDGFGGKIDVRETFEHAFSVPGTYSYFCVPHETEGRGDGRMIATLTVTE